MQEVVGSGRCVWWKGDSCGETKYAESGYDYPQVCDLRFLCACVWLGVLEPSVHP